MSTEWGHLENEYAVQLKSKNKYQSPRGAWYSVAHPEDEGVEQKHWLKAIDNGPGFHPPGSHNASDTAEQT